MNEEPNTIEKSVGQTKEVDKSTNETVEDKSTVIVNEDFSFIGKDGRTCKLQFKQKAFADFYLEMGGDRVEAIIEAGYDVNYKSNKGVDTGVPNRKLASVMAYELLLLPHITSYINSKLEEMGFNAENVEEQHLFLLNQHADLKMKGKAIDMYYKVKGKYPKEQKGDLNINVFSLADLAERHNKRKQLGFVDVVKTIEAEEKPTDIPMTVNDEPVPTDVGGREVKLS